MDACFVRFILMQYVLDGCFNYIHIRAVRYGCEFWLGSYYRQYVLDACFV